MSAVAISIYGAGLSTMLAFWQFWRAYQERRWVTTSYNFRGIEDPGNEILLINNSPKPITLYNIELFWGQRKLGWMRRYQRVGADPWGDEDSDTGLTIEPFKIATLHYTGERHFHFRYERRSKARLYLRTRIVGRRRQMTLLVYRQNRWNPTRIKMLLTRLGFETGFGNPYIDEQRDGDLEGPALPKLPS